MPRKARIDSPAEIARVMARVPAKLSPPKNVPLEESDLPFFESVIEEFARSDWTAHQLELAAMLARDLSDRERAQRKLREEGEVIISIKGHACINPYRTAVQTLAGTILAMRRSLALHSRARAGDPRDKGKRRDAMKAIEANVDQNAEDDLIARPN